MLTKTCLFGSIVSLIENKSIEPFSVINKERSDLKKKMTMAYTVRIN